MSVKAAFDRSAQDYDRVRRLLIPKFDDFYATAIEHLPEIGPAPLSILDLGAGTGVMSEFVLEARVGSRLTLVDVSGEMLAQARARLEDVQPLPKFIESDYSKEPLGGPYDAVVSALSIHHLEDADKAALFVSIFASLKPGGVFINAEQVRGSTDALHQDYHRRWLEAVRALGVPEPELRSAQERMRYDRPASVRDQIDWLLDAGFADVDCPFKHDMFAVLVGKKRA